jgi:hypothetical protein
MVQPTKDYGFESGGRIADWSCEICKKVIYEKTNIRDIPRERLSDVCVACRQALDKAHQISEEWWDAERERLKKFGFPKERPNYISTSSPEKGMYALRDDLADHFLRGVTSPRLKRFAQRISKELPARE